MLDERVRDRIIAETRGNPLALLELPRGPDSDAAGRWVRDAGRACALGADRGELHPAARGAPRGRAAACCSSRRPSRSAIRCSCCARPSDSGSRFLPSTRRTGCWTLGERVTFRHPLVRSAVYRSARRVGAPSGASGAGGGDGSKRRPGSSCVASGCCGGGPRRGGRAGAGAFRGPGAGARRPRRRGGVPAAGGRADRRSGAARRPSARRRPGQPAGRGHSTRRVGCWRRRRPGRWTSSSAPAWICCAPRPRTPRAAAARRRRCSSEPRRRSSRSICSSRARRISTRGARRCSPGSSRAPRACTTSRVRLGRLPGPCSPRVRPICCCDGFALAFTDGRAAAAPVLERAAAGFAGDDVSIEEVLRWGWLATAAAVMVWDYDTCLAVATPRGRARPRARVRWPCSRSASTCWRQAVALGGEFGSVAMLVAEADSVTEATGTHVAPVRRARARRPSGTRGRGVRADRRHDQGGHRRRSGNRGPVRALGELASPQRSRPLSRRRWPPPGRRATTHRSCSSPSGRRASWSSPRPGATSRNWRAARSSASSRPRAVADTDWALGHPRRDRARC